MSTITWLHLSDLHFRAEEQDTWDQNLVLKALLEDIRGRAKEDNLRPDFVVVTGDIAFSGKPAEYDLARHFFDELLYTTGLPKDRLFLVPGNHDVDRSLVTPEAQATGDSLQDRRLTNTALCTPEDQRLLFAGLTHYMAFVKDYLPHLTLQDEGLFFVHSLELQGQRIALLGLNSAWVCASDEDEAKKLLLGERQARGALGKANDKRATLKIALLHHPFDRLRDFDRDVVEPVLCKGCMFVLHGHLHRSGILILRSPDAEAMVIGAGASYESRDLPNRCNWVRLNLAECVGAVFLRRYSDAGGGFWAPDTLTYQNAPTGEYRLALPDPSRWSPVEESPEKPDEGKPSDQSGKRGEMPPGPSEKPKPPRRRVPFWAVLLLSVAVLAGIIIAVLYCLPSGGRIAYASGAADSLQIYVMDANGRNKAQLTDNAALNESPAWSPDGKRLAFHSKQDGNPEIYVINADGTGQENLTNNPDDDGSPSWSPDGRLIAFDTNRDGNVEIYVMNADGSGATNLTNHPARDSLPAWSPDGKQIAFTSHRDGNAEIYLMNPDGSNQRRLTDNPAGDESPAWSPDGERIAFFSYRDGRADIYVMNADGSGVRRLTDNIASDRSPSWSPDGKRIAFESDRDENWETYVMNADGSDQTNLTHSPAQDHFPAWRR